METVLPSGGGGGVAWLPEFSIADELADGTLVRMGGASWTASLTISLFCSPDRLDEPHPAVPGDREALVVTEAGYLPASQFAGLKQRYAVFDFDFLVVNQQLSGHSEG